MAGKICKIISGKFEGKIAQVDNEQRKEFLDRKKVQAWIFETIGKPVLDNGRHVNTLISMDKLKVQGFYD